MANEAAVGKNGSALTSDDRSQWQEWTKGYGHWRNQIFIVFWITYGAFYLCRVNFSVAIPDMMKEFGWSPLPAGGGRDLPVLGLCGRAVHPRPDLGAVFFQALPLHDDAPLGPDEPADDPGRQVRPCGARRGLGAERVLPGRRVAQLRENPLPVVPAQGPRQAHGALRRLLPVRQRDGLAAGRVGHLAGRLARGLHLRPAHLRRDRLHPAADG